MGISQTAGVNEAKVTWRFVFASVLESTEVAEIVIGEDGEVVDV